MLFPPGAYLRLVKRPGVKRAGRQLLTDDALTWLLLAATARPASPRLLAGALCCFAGFWAAYELGYWDNDRCAVRYEAKPVLGPAFPSLPRHFPAQALGFALLFSLAGLGLLGARPAQAARWAGLLAALGVIYALYNRLDKTSRVYLYPGLQGCRSLGLLAVLPLGPAGLAAGAAQAIARWLGYCLYRFRPAANGAWPDIPTRFLHLLLLLFFGAILLATPARAVLFSWPALALLAQAVFLARRDLRAAWRNARWLPAAR